MFQSFAEVGGFDKRHQYIQCGFRKTTGANFNAMDIRIFIEFTVPSQINLWVTRYSLNCQPYYKIEYSRCHVGFNGWFMEVVTDPTLLKTDLLMKMKDQRPFSQIYLRIYYK